MKLLHHVLPSRSVNDGVNGRIAYTELHGEASECPSVTVGRSHQSDLVGGQLRSGSRPDVTVPGVVGVSANIEVIRAYACGRIAMMQDVRSRQERTVNRLPHQAMGQLGLTGFAWSASQTPVSVRHPRPAPQPAARREIDLSKEAFELVHAPIIAERGML
jgi:hypothetical protein